MPMTVVEWRGTSQYESSSGNRSGDNSKLVGTFQRSRRSYNFSTTQTSGMGSLRSLPSRTYGPARYAL